MNRYDEAFGPFRGEPAHSLRAISVFRLRSQRTSYSKSAHIVYRLYKILHFGAEGRLGDVNAHQRSVNSSPTIISLANLHTLKLERAHSNHLQPTPERTVPHNNFTIAILGSSHPNSASILKVEVVSSIAMLIDPTDRALDLNEKS